MRQWLRRLVHHIQEFCGVEVDKTPTVLHEDNAACIAQMKNSYVKYEQQENGTHMTKHILPKYVYSYEHQENGNIEIQKIQTSENLMDLFTKALPRPSFEKLVCGFGMRRHKELLSSGGDI